MSARLDGDRGRIVETALREARDALFRAGEPDIDWSDALVEIANRSLDTIDSPDRRDRFRIHLHVNLATIAHASTPPADSTGQTCGTTPLIQPDLDALIDQASIRPCATNDYDLVTDADDELEVEAYDLPDLNGDGESNAAIRRRCSIELERILGSPGHMVWPDGTPIPDELRRRLCCDSIVVPTLWIDGAPFILGRSTRVIPDRLRRLILLRDKGCRVPAAPLNDSCRFITSSIGKTAASPMGPTSSPSARSITACTTNTNSTSPATPPDQTDSPSPTATVDHSVPAANTSSRVHNQRSGPSAPTDHQRANDSTSATSSSPRHRPRLMIHPTARLR